MRHVALDVVLALLCSLDSRWVHTSRSGTVELPSRWTADGLFTSLGRRWSVWRGDEHHYRRLEAECPYCQPPPSCADRPGWH